MREYVLGHAAASERWLCRFMKFMYENFRAQRFDPTTAAVHCRFDDPLPTAFLGVVNFNGRPRQAYWSVQEACQPVLPILFLDYTGAQDVRVVNEYWRRGWKGCRLTYLFRTRDRAVLRRGERVFDLPPDATVKVLTREEIGDLYAQPGGFVADLEVRDAEGKVLSRNHYDLTAEDLRLFVESVYPTPPVAPYGSLLLRASEAADVSGASRRMPGEGTYSPTLLELGGESREPHLRFAVRTERAGEYLLRASCTSGEALRACEAWVDGKRAILEAHPYVDMNAGITRLPYSAYGLAWRPGWVVTLPEGDHTVEFRWPQGQPASRWIIDAVCLQYRGPVFREGSKGSLR